MARPLLNTEALRLVSKVQPVKCPLLMANTALPCPTLAKFLKHKFCGLRENFHLVKITRYTVFILTHMYVSIVSTIIVSSKNCIISIIGKENII